VIQGDLDSLMAYLEANGVSVDDRGEVEAALAADGGSLGARVNGWLGEMTVKTASRLPGDHRVGWPPRGILLADPDAHLGLGDVIRDDRPSASWDLPVEGAQCLGRLLELALDVGGDSLCPR